jgi:NTP pyrophosphatase (non-canonical NTP hydrolase)
VDPVNEFDTVWQKHAEWSQATFGSDKSRGPLGSLKHLQKEATEAVEAFEADQLDDLAAELADCLLLVFDAARRSGLSQADLLTLAHAKLEINKRRTWPRPRADEPCEHEG